MEALKYYKSYRENRPEYLKWSKNQDTNYAKRIEYLKNNPNKMSGKDIQRGKILLHAIDVIDEYSQSNAEDTEVATEMAKTQVMSFAQMIGGIGGFTLINNKKISSLLLNLAGNNEYLKLGVNAIPSLLGIVAATAITFPAVVVATKLKVGASRRGRFEAMNNDLKSPAIFAILTPEQQKKVDELSKNIELDDKEKKRLEKTKNMGINPLDSFNTLKKMYVGESEYKKQKEIFDNNLKESELRLGVVIPNEQIRDAKRDKQILSDMVRKIDIASQDYAENTELVTNTIGAISIGSGGLVGWLSSKILGKLKISQASKYAKIIPWFIGFSIPLTMSAYFTKVQKQASRIGRFKIKQEMLNNPESFGYVDEKDIDSVNDIKDKNVYKKPNLLEFASNLIKDYKEYTQYVKNEAVNELKKHKVIENIDLTQEQLKEAKQLQINVFKTFNKVDEKSQAYSENIEAIGSMTQQVLSFVLTIYAAISSFLSITKVLKDTSKVTNVIKASALAAIKPVLIALVPAIALDVVTTKLQKRASRVADMLALKELDDYRHYVDYSQFDSKFIQAK